MSCGYGLQWHALPCGTESPSATTDQPRDVEQAIAKEPTAIKAAAAKPNRADHLTQRIVAGPRASVGVKMAASCAFHPGLTFMRQCWWQKGDSR